LKNEITAGKKKLGEKYHNTTDSNSKNKNSPGKKKLGEKYEVPSDSNSKIH
jgi:hypothetical protein